MNDENYPPKLDHDQGFTLRTGVIVTNEDARRRIVAWLGQNKIYKIPLVDRQLLAYAVVNDTWHARCLVTYLQVVALEIWQQDWQVQAEAGK